MVDSDPLRRVPSIGSRAQAVAEAGGWSVFIPDLPVAADAVGFDEAVAEMVDALREYASDWIDRLSAAPNHVDNGGLVQMVWTSTDEQLAQWITGGAQSSAVRP